MDFISFAVLVLLRIIILAILLISIIFIYLTVASGFMHSSPSVPSCGKIKDAMLRSVATKLTNSSEQMTIIDLGSGWGSLLLPLAKQFPQHKFIGYEIARLPFFISSLRGRKLKNICFLRQDILEANISSADIIFLFLLPNMMKKLTKKCQYEMKKSSLIYVNRFPFPNIKETEKVSLGSDYYSYYIYKM